MKEKQNLVITIGRQYGSGGRIVGKALAEELGIHFYDEEILTMTSEQSAVGEVFFRLADEKAGNNLLYKIVSGMKPQLGKPSTDGDIVKPENCSVSSLRLSGNWQTRSPASLPDAVLITS